MYTVNAFCNDNLTLSISCITMVMVPYGSVVYDILAKMAQLTMNRRYSPVMEFILNNFKLNTYERQELRCKSHIKNEWGTLILPDGTTINPKELQIVRFTYKYSECDVYKDMYDIWNVSAFYVVLHENELYYLDVDEAMYIVGNPWNYHDNTICLEDEYIVPNMYTCNHHLYPLEHNVFCVSTWDKKEWRKIDMNDASIANLAKIERYMKHMW